MEEVFNTFAGVIATRSGNSNTPVVGNLILEGEGVSPVAVDPNSSVQILIPYKTNVVSGNPTTSRDENITINNPTYAALANAPVGQGNVMVMFDRQPMWNNGPGSDIEERDNSQILLNIMEFLDTSDETTTAGFVTDPNKIYHIENPQHGLRLAANGSSQNPYTTSLNDSGSDTQWKFVQNSSGLWHIQRAAGGTIPRIRTRNTTSPDMQAISSSGDWTQFQIDPSSTYPGTYYLTLPEDGASPDFSRLRISSVMVL